MYINIKNLISLFLLTGTVRDSILILAIRSYPPALTNKYKSMFYRVRFMTEGGGF